MTTSEHNDLSKNDSSQNHSFQYPSHQSSADLVKKIGETDLIVRQFNLYRNTIKY